MKTSFARLVSILIRSYFRYFPLATGKVVIWNRIVRPYIAWRRIPMIARSKFRVSFRGDLRDLIHRYLYFFGVWEPGVTGVMRWHLRQGDRIIDIGANVGAHALLAATLVGTSGRVYAIEASPSIFQRLLANIERNGLNQVKPLNVAVTDVDTVLSVFLHGAENLGATTTVNFEAERRGIAVETQIAGHPLSGILPLDEILASRLIKIDVEGAEWLVLRGMNDVLPKLDDACIILIEVNQGSLGHFGASLETLLGMMKVAGWEALEVQNDYDPAFYLHPSTHLVRPLATPRNETLDLLFARPAMRSQVLSSHLA